MLSRANPMAGGRADDVPVGHTGLLIPVGILLPPAKTPSIAHTSGFEWFEDKWPNNGGARPRIDLDQERGRAGPVITK